MNLPSRKPARRRQSPLPPLQKLGVTRRPKRPELTRPQKIAFIAGPLLLVPIITVGVITDKNEEAKVTAKIAPSAPASVTAPASAPPSTADPPESAEPSSTPSQSEASDEETRDYDENNLQFGQTGRYLHGYGRPYPEVPLEFTVSEPIAFKPSKNAKYTDVFGFPYGGEGPHQPANVYFTVTLTNTSKDETYDVTVRASVSKSGDDEEQSYVEDGDIGKFWDLDTGDDLDPGESVTVRDGWSLKNADDVRYELRIDGVGGDSFYFTR